MKTNTLIKPIVYRSGALIALLSAGFATTSFAGPERLPDYGKDKQIEMIQPEPDPKWYVSVGVGSDFDTDATDFSNGLQIAFDDTFAANFANVIDRLPFNNTITAAAPDLVFQGAELTIKERSWDDAFSNFFRVKVEVGRRVTDHIELFGRFNYAHADGETVTGSNLTIFFSGFDFEVPFTSTYGDYNSYGGELGARFYLRRPDATFNPYVAISGGANFVDCINLHTWTNVLGQSFDVFNDTFYGDSVVGTGSLMIGMKSRITRSISVGFEVGVRYESTLCAPTLFEESMSPTILTGSIGSDTISQLNSLNHDAGDRLIIPVMTYTRISF